MLAVPNHHETMIIVDQLRRRGFGGTVAALAEYSDHVAELEGAGVRAFTYHDQAGAGFADHAREVAELGDTAGQGSTTSRRERACAEITLRNGRTTLPAL